MSERKTRVDRDAEVLASMDNDSGQVVAIVVGRRLIAVEHAEHQRALAGQNTGEMQLMEHALDAVRMLADIFEEQDAAIDRREMMSADEVRDHREIAAPQHAFALEIGPVESAIDDMLRAIEQTPAMFQ